MHGQAGANRRCHGFVDDVDATCASAFSGFLDGTPFHLRGAVRHADEHARRRPQPAVAVHFVDEELQHLFRVREVGDDAVLHGPHGSDMPRRAAEHAFRVVPHGEHLVGARFDCDDRRFA